MKSRTNHPARGRRVGAALVFAAAVASIAPVLSVNAETRTWTGSYDQFWYQRWNWDPADVPGAGDHLKVYYGYVTAGGIAISTDGGGAILLDGPDTTLVETNNFFVGQNFHGDFTIRNGATFDMDGTAWSEVHVGYNAGASGTVLCEGLGTKWTDVLVASIGTGGDGTLTVRDQARLSTGWAQIGYDTGSRGTATICDANTYWGVWNGMSIGELGDGRLTVQNGALVETPHLAMSKWGGDSTLRVIGTAVVPAEMRVNGSIELQNGWPGGSATIELADGGLLTCQSAWIAPALLEEARITIDGGVWTNSGTLSIGPIGSVSMTIDHGGQVSNGIADLGGSYVDVIVASGTWTSQQLYVGPGTLGGYPNDTVTVDDGGWVQTAENLSIRPGGFVQVNSGGTIVADVLDVDIANGAAFTESPGAVLRVNNLARLGDAISINGSLQMGHAGGSGYADYTVGAGQSLTVGEQFSIGHDAPATFTISGGGQVTTSGGRVASLDGSSATVLVDGAGSVWNADAMFGSDWFWVGLGGDGEIHITNGGLLNAYLAVVGYIATPGATGAIYVDGATSTFQCAGLLIGPDSRVEATNGGRVTTASDISVVWGGLLSIESGGSLSSASGTTKVDGPVTSAAAMLVSGVGTRWTTAGDLVVGDSNHGSLTIADGAVASVRHVDLARSPGSSANVLVNGPSAIWKINGDLVVGGNHSLPPTAYSGGTAELTISGGGRIEANGTSVAIGMGTVAHGTVTVEGLNSKLLIANDLYIGRGGGRGVLDVNRQAFAGADRIEIGGDDGSAGTVTIDGLEWGMGAALSSGGPLIVGGQGQGTLYILSGGYVFSGSGWIGSGFGGAGTVAVVAPGATWVVEEDLAIGGTPSAWGGSGHMRLDCPGTASVGGTLKVWPGSELYLDQGRITCRNLDLSINSKLKLNGGTLTIDGGQYLNGQGLLNVEGYSGPTVALDHGATASVSSIGIGVLNPGTLRILNGSTATANQMSVIGGNPAAPASANGLMTVDGPGSGVSIDANLYIAGNDTSAGGRGELRVQNGASVSVTGLLKVWPNGTVSFSSGALRAGSVVSQGAFTFTGGTLAVGSFSGDLINGGGTISPGGSVGVTQITGNYTQTQAGCAKIELAGPTAAEFDRLNVSGVASLSGAIDLSILGQYNPAPLVAHEVLSAQQVTGRFALVRSPVISPSRCLAVTYDADSVLVTATFPGDANLDGQVDITDLAALATNWQQSGCWSLGDFDGSGFIDITDLAALATNWQAGVGAPLAMSFDQAMASVGLTGVRVPEPVGSALVVLWRWLLLRRRRYEKGQNSPFG